MRRHILAIVLALCSVVALADEPAAIELTDQEATALRVAETAGLTIFRHDRAAAVATDAARKLRKFKKDRRVRGWITEELQGEIVVTFIDQSPAALYRIAVSPNGLAGPVASLDKPAPLTAFESGAAAARAAALASDFQPCSKSYNPVVLPTADATGKDWVVYLLPGTTKKYVVPIGGTYRLEVSGSNVTSQRGFTRSCVALQGGPKSVGLVITHLLDPIPTEAHVFWSMWSKQPLYVLTVPDRSMWKVDGDRISLMQRKLTEN